MNFNGRGFQSDSPGRGQVGVHVVHKNPNTLAFSKVKQTDNEPIYIYEIVYFIAASSRLENKINPEYKRS